MAGGTTLSDPKVVCMGDRKLTKKNDQADGPGSKGLGEGVPAVELSVSGGEDRHHEEKCTQHLSGESIANLQS